MVDEFAASSTRRFHMCLEADTGSLGLDPGSPWAHIEEVSQQCPSGSSQAAGAPPSPTPLTKLAMTSQDPASYFTVTRPSVADIDGKFAVALSSNVSTPYTSLAGGSPLFPHIFGAHFQTCSPDCTSDRIKHNTCPASCGTPFGNLENALNAVNGTDLLSFGGTRILHVYGWVVDPLKGGTALIGTVYARVDAIAASLVLPSASIHLARTDVSSVYGTDYPNNDFYSSGYDGTIDVSSIQLAAGAHTLNIFAVDRNQVAFQVGARTFYVECNAGSCPTGCCSSSRSSCTVGSANTACGTSGAACVNCSSLGSYSCATDRTCHVCVAGDPCSGTCGGIRTDGCGNTVNCPRPSCGTGEICSAGSCVPGCPGTQYLCSCTPNDFCTTSALSCQHACPGG